ncbi:MAG: exodeoxyribonuclease III [Planctomycetes bacterium]|nr:exodeoxyribonuclease III [Planctomycetota bacterium]
MLFVSWNVNGIRAARTKGLLQWLDRSRPDVLGLQEIKARPEQLGADLLEEHGYHVVWNPAQRPGYSGVATFSRTEPDEVELGFGIERFDVEGRVIGSRHGKVWFYNVYFPNGGAGDERLQYKLEFYEALREHLNARVARRQKVIVAGDWNTAHREIDLARPGPNRKISGFMPIECDTLDLWFQDGWIDSFRHFHPDRAGAYSWWSMRAGSRERNVGWRIDYQVVSKNLAKDLESAAIWPEVPGSDHCPIALELGA